MADVVSLAAAVEVLHSASLVHDWVGGEISLGNAHREVGRLTEWESWSLMSHWKFQYDGWRWKM